MGLTAGTTLGRYELRTKLGAGGMAEVWEAFDQSLHRTVAVKVVLENMSADEEFRQRFQREARVVAGLRHRSILAVFDFGEDQGRPYLVMPLMTAGHLRDRMQGVVSPEMAVVWLREIAEGLDHANARGIVHRDVKPSNVLVDADGHLTLADFGLARDLKTGSGALTAPGLVMGTANYIAPEQALGQDLDGRCDQYALGVIAFEMLTGKLPFSAPTSLLMLNKHISEAPPKATKVNPQLPPAVDDVMRKVLAKTAPERYPSCVAFVDALEKAILPMTEAMAVAGLPLRGSGEVPRPRASASDAPARDRRPSGPVRPPAARPASGSAPSSSPAGGRAGAIVAALLAGLVLATGGYFLFGRLRDKGLLGPVASLLEPPAQPTPAAGAEEPARPAGGGAPATAEQPVPSTASGNTAAATTAAAAAAPTPEELPVSVVEQATPVPAAASTPGAVPSPIPTPAPGLSPVAPPAGALDPSNLDRFQVALVRTYPAGSTTAVLVGLKAILSFREPVDLPSEPGSVVSAVLHGASGEKVLLRPGTPTPVQPAPARTRTVELLVPLSDALASLADPAYDTIRLKLAVAGRTFETEAVIPPQARK